MRKTQILINRLVYLALLILDLSKSLMYEFWYDYIKAKYGEKAKLCYMDTGSFISMSKQRIFTMILENMLKQNLALQVMKQIYRCLQEK